MAAEFNYARAWRELAGPAYAKLNNAIVALYKHVVEHGHDWAQDSNLQVPVPEELRLAFAEIESCDLAVAARTIYFWGHWAHCSTANVMYTGEQPFWLESLASCAFRPADHGSHTAASRAAEAWIKERIDSHPDEVGDWKIEYDHNGPGSDSHGAHWKFSNMADQVLRVRLDLGIHGRPGNTGFTVNEGVLRMVLREEIIDIGWATEKTSRRARQIRTDESCDWQHVRKRLMADDPHKAWFDTEQFMDHKEGTSYEDSELSQVFQPAVAAHFLVWGVQQVNHKPHPFTIGPRHLEGSSMLLDPDSAPCAFQEGRHRQLHELGCRLSYAEHTSDRVVFLQCKHNVTKSEAEGCLLVLKPSLEEHKCDGIAFVESEEGYEIIDDPT